MIITVSTTTVFLVLSLCLQIYILYRLSLLETQIKDTFASLTRVETKPEKTSDRESSSRGEIKKLSQKISNLKQKVTGSRNSVQQLQSLVYKSNLKLEVLTEYLLKIDTSFDNWRKRDDTLVQLRGNIQTIQSVASRIESSVNFHGRVSIQVCKMFATKEISERLLPRENLEAVTKYKIIPFENIVAKNEFHKLDLPKNIKGYVGEELVVKFLKSRFVTKDFRIVHVGNEMSMPDIILEYSGEKRVTVCIEVKNWHVSVDEENLKKFRGYCERDDYDAGILVSVGRGTIKGKSNFSLETLYKKPALYISCLNYNLLPLYYGVLLVLNSI